MKKTILKSEQDTIDFAQRFAKKLKAGQTIALVGELGVGKTFFTKALGKALGVKQTIKSPSFNLMKIYAVKTGRRKSRSIAGLEPNHNIKTIIHVDCYRLNTPEELIDIGFLDYLKQKNTLIIVEWADKVKKILPKDTVWLKFRMKKDGSRAVAVSDTL